MDLKGFVEWVAASDDLGKKVISLVGTVGSFWAVVVGYSGRVMVWVGLPREAGYVVASVVALASVALVWRGYRRFAAESRLEQPEKFDLRPTDPGGLIGRETDLSDLLDAVKKSRLVLYAGESGCGKSALIRAGLVPQLRESQGLLPLEINDWGDDWESGPLCAALEALFNAVSPSDRTALQWIGAPYLAADATALALDLDIRIKTVFTALGRRPLLIADQFDDYQAHFRDRFLDPERNWLAPSELARANLFWESVRAGLEEGRVHLLVVTRDDMAMGLGSVLFLGERDRRMRPLFRVAEGLLRPLLMQIAPDDANPPVISNPQSGWIELRDKLEQDLTSEGGLLMQQVRTALLGLRHLRRLTPRHYRIAGGLRGVETLFVSAALRRAVSRERAGPGIDTARALLGKLIQHGSADQQPKARRVPFSELAAGSDCAQTTRILMSLQRDELVRPADSVAEDPTWQLDHDYLARAVLAESRQADKWNVVLNDGYGRYREAAGAWLLTWRTLLPLTTLFRLLWERANRRIRFGEAKGFAILSAVKPVLYFLPVLLIVSIGQFVKHREGLGLPAHRSSSINHVQSIPEPPDTVRQPIPAIDTTMGASQDVFAWTVCNETASSQPIAVAVVHQQSADSITLVAEGWYHVAPRKCQLIGIFPKGAFYWYAESKSRRWEAAVDDPNGETVCVTEGAFVRYYHGPCYSEHRIFNYHKVSTDEYRVTFD